MRDSCPTFFSSHWVNLWLHSLSHGSWCCGGEGGIRTHGPLPVNVFWACRSWRPSEQLEGGQHDAVRRDYEADARQDGRVEPDRQALLKCQHVGFQRGYIGFQCSNVGFRRHVLAHGVAERGDHGFGLRPPRIRLPGAS